MIAPFTTRKVEDRQTREGDMGSRKRQYSNITVGNLRNIGNQLRIARRINRLSQEGLAHTLCISPNTIRRVEQGNPVVEIGVFFEVAMLLNVEVTIKKIE